MMDEPAGRPAALEGHDQGVDTQAGLEVIRHGPAHDLARGQVLDGRQVEKALVGWNIREILSANSLDLVGWAWALGKSGVAERYEGGQQQDRPAPRLDRRPLPSSPPNSPTVSRSHPHTSCGPPGRVGAGAGSRPGPA